MPPRVFGSRGVCCLPVCAVCGAMLGGAAERTPHGRRWFRVRAGKMTNCCSVVAVLAALGLPVSVRLPGDCKRGEELPHRTRARLRREAPF